MTNHDVTDRSHETFYRDESGGKSPSSTGRAAVGDRQRGTLAVIATAAAVAVVAATAFLVGRGGNDRSPALPTTSSGLPSASAPTSPQGSVSSSAPLTEQPPTGVLDVTNLPTGPTPAIAYLQGGTMHLPDGRIVMPGTTYRPTSFSQLSDGTVVYLTQRGTTEAFAVEVVTADGSHHGPYPSGYALVVNADHSVVAWLSRDNQPMSYHAGATGPVGLAVTIPGNSQRIAAVTGTDCAVPGGCRIYASSWQGQRPTAWVATTPGTLSQADPAGRLVAVRDATETGLLLGYTRITDTGSTSAVMDVTASDHPLLWQTSRHTLDAFAPDRTHLLAGPAYRDGIGDGQIAIYSPSGSLLVNRQTSDRHPGFLQNAVWEDSRHVLFVVFQNDQWSVVRMNIGGTMEHALPPVPGQMDHNPFALETTP
jgi:hypothetical protein